MTTPEEIAHRAAVLHALDQPALAVQLVEPGFDDAALGLELACALARELDRDPDTARVPWATDLSPACARLAYPVVREVVTLTRGGHLGGLHQVWHRVPQHTRQDAIKVLLAVCGTVLRHPERN